MFRRLVLGASVALLCAVPAASAAAAPPPFVPIHLEKIPLPKGFQASTPIWTLDGKHLLFSSGGELYRIGQDGKGLRCLSCGVAGNPHFEPAVQEAFKDVFPDGRRILWGDFTRAFVLECAPSVLDCRSRKLLPIDVGAAQPAGGAFTLDNGVWHLAPDGQHLGWTASRLDTRPMLVGKLRREADTYVTTGVRTINPPGPSSLTDPDPRGWTNAGALYELKGFTHGGRSVTYVSSQFEGNPDVFEVDLRTGARTRLTAHPDWDEDDAVSPDGRSLVVYSDRGMHRVDAAGLVPRRSFIDYPLSANAAIYYVGTPIGFQCDLQPWLLPAGGDADGRLAGQPLYPYSGGDIHAQNNVPGRGAWSPDSTKVALTEMSYKTAMGINRLMIARLDRAPSRAERVVSSRVGSWAVTPAAYRGVTDSGASVVVRGLRGGTATVSYSGSIAAGSFSVTYDGYTDDGRSFVDGYERLESTGFGVVPAHATADLTISGAHKGRMQGDYSIGRQDGTPAASGGVDAELDGYELAGNIPPLGPCPSRLPRAQQLVVSARVVDGRVHARVLVDAAPEVQTSRGRGDTRPVAGAVVQVGRRSVRTDSTGRAVLPAGSAQPLVRASAGDTFLPVRVRAR
jgi:hypothetical protein